MGFLLAASALAFLPVVPVAPDDERLDHPRTFVSPNAEHALEQDEGEVYCLDRPRRQRYRSICLTKSEWQAAIRRAEAAPKPGPRPVIPHDYRVEPNPYGRLGYLSR